jgi:hypothetical protein
MIALRAAPAPSRRQPDPEARVAEQVGEEHKQHPPGLDEEGLVFATEFDRSEVTQYEQRHEQNQRHLLHEQEEEHESHHIRGGGPGGRR